MLSTPKKSFSGLSVEEGYSVFLGQWKEISKAQLTALQAGDWKAFEEALQGKETLIRAWEAFVREQPLPLSRCEVPSPVRERWLVLAREVEALDREIEAVLQTLRRQLRDEMRLLEQERRAARSYYSRLRHLSPRYLDKKL